MRHSVLVVNNIVIVTLCRRLLTLSADASCVQMEVKSFEVLVRFALMHLIATNTSVWLRTLIHEIMFEYEHMTHHDDHDDHNDHHDTAISSSPGQTSLVDAVIYVCICVMYT